MKIIIVGFFAIGVLFPSLAAQTRPEIVFVGVKTSTTFTGTRVDASAPVPRIPPPMAPVTDHSIMGFIARDAELISAFRVGKGRANAMYLIRAIGPTLSQLGVENALERPVVRMFRNGEIWSESGAWSVNATVDRGLVERMREAERMAGAFPLELGSNDVAFVSSLPEGTYTVNVGTADGKSGRALVQMYELPALAVENSPPTLPDYYGNLSVRTGQTLELLVSSSDRDKDDLEILVDWDDDGWADELIPARSGLYTKVTRHLSISGTWHVRIGVRDARGALGEGVGAGIRLKVEVRPRDE